MSAYTPTTDQVRMAWIRLRWESNGQLRFEGSDAEFDRWLATLKGNEVRETEDEVAEMFPGTRAALGALTTTPAAQR